MSAPCYAINGSDHNRDVVPFVPDEPKWVPCNNTAVGEGKHSACCALGDVCLTNGLCQNPADYWNGGNAFWTEGCTDKTFNDPACPDYCAERWFETPVRNTYTVVVYRCARQKTWCCTPPYQALRGSDTNTECCHMENSTFSAPELSIYTTARDTTITPTPSPTPSPTLSPFASSYPSSGTPSGSATQGLEEVTGLSSAAKVGLGVGLALGVVLLVGVAVGLWLWKRKTLVIRRPAMHYHVGEVVPKVAEIYGHEVPAELPTELYGRGVSTELPTVLR